VLGTAVDGPAVPGTPAVGSSVDGGKGGGVALQSGHVVTVDPGGLDSKENVSAPSSFRIPYNEPSHDNVFVSAVSHPLPAPLQSADCAEGGDMGVITAAPGP